MANTYSIVICVHSFEQLRRRNNFLCFSVGECSQHYNQGSHAERVCATVGAVMATDYGEPKHSRHVWPERYLDCVTGNGWGRVLRSDLEGVLCQPKGIGNEVFTHALVSTCGKWLLSVSAMSSGLTFWDFLQAMYILKILLY